MMTPDDKLQAAQDMKSQTEGSMIEVSSLDNILRDIDSGEINELAVVAEGEEKTTWFVWILVMCSTISGLLFGRLIGYLRQNVATRFLHLSMS